MDAGLLLAVGALVVAPLVGYITATRKLSGKIATSEASDLWAESKQIRDDYRDRIDRANVRQADLEKRVATLESLNTELARENLALRARIDVLEAENADLHRQVDALQKKLARKETNAEQ